MVEEAVGAVAAMVAVVAAETVAAEVVADDAVTTAPRGCALKILVSNWARSLK
jgi:hypothetical protein